MIRHRLLTSVDYRRMPWRNGAGRTTEIASHPPGAALDAFDWRVSVADVLRDGPFSRFEGIDRTIMVIAGAGMRLDGAGAPVPLRERFAPHAFRGEEAITGVLLDGPVRDFNLMVRRDRCRGDVAVVRGRPASIAPAAFRLCYVAVGAFTCQLAGRPPLTLTADQCLYVEDGDARAGTLAVSPSAADAVALVTRIERQP